MLEGINIVLILVPIYQVLPRPVLFSRLANYRVHVPTDPLRPRSPAHCLMSVSSVYSELTLESVHVEMIETSSESRRDEQNTRKN